MSQFGAADPLYQLVNRRELRSITIGSRRLITADDLDAYIAARQHESGAAA